MDNNQIDFVITWVNPNDDEWLAQRKKYINDDKEANGEVRYRDWDLLKYVFRSIELNCPWFNKVFFVTCGQMPEWMNVDNKKLVLINHRDFIQEKYLPTFNSNAIELCFHRICELNEQFVYLNDDMFVMSKMNAEDFFKNGKPVDSFAWNAVSAKNDNSMIEHIVLNDMEILDKYFEKKVVQKKVGCKLLNLKNWPNVTKTILLYPFKHFTGIENHHMPCPYLKSNLTLLWSKEEERLLTTVMNKFRTSSDYSLWLARYWALLNGQFELCSRRKDLYYVLEDNCDFSILEKNDIRLLCLNDSDTINEFDSIKNRIIEIMNKRFPTKSSFEL